MRKVSAKLQARNELYSVQRKVFLEENPHCALCNGNATQIHHRRRRGIYTNDVAWFMACCASCHQKIEENGRWSRANGYIID